MCDCKEKTEAGLQEEAIRRFPDATDHKAALMGYAIIFGNPCTVRGYMPIEFTAKHPLKKGGYKDKTTKMNMQFTFCPFCGVKYA